MAKSRQFFHDRIILVFLAINAFLVLAITANTLLNLSGSSDEDYIKGYRANLGLDAFQSGSTVDSFAFIGFALLVFAIQLIIGKKIYHISKDASFIIVFMTTLTLAFALLVSNALLSIG